MGSSCEGGQCRGPSFSEHRKRRSIEHRQRRSVNKDDYFYDLLQGDDSTSNIDDDDDDDKEVDNDDVYGHIIFTPKGVTSSNVASPGVASAGKTTKVGERHRRSVPALMPARYIVTPT